VDRIVVEDVVNPQELEAKLRKSGERFPGLGAWL
jgi:hypothetical protein